MKQMRPEAAITLLLKNAVGKESEALSFVVERAENSAHGDYATNIAFKLVPQLKKAPLAIAQELARKMQEDVEDSRMFAKIEAAPPGFVNFTLRPEWLAKQVGDIVTAGKTYGIEPRSLRQRKKVQIEFISANPTGPLTLANGRGGFLGDTLANILEATGQTVVREYYVNDMGEQIKKLGWSVLKAAGYSAPYKDEELYQGSYIQDLAKSLGIPNAKAKNSNEVGKPNNKLAESVAREASKLLLVHIKKITRKAGVRFDVWFSEQSLHRQGFVKEVLTILKRKRLLEEREGALWLRAKELGETKDRVLVKSNGDPTYLLPDLAYHYETFVRRKFGHVIDIFGADHHGQAQALKAGMKMLGLPEPEVILVQFVHLIEKGKVVKMSKRSGTFVTLEELLDEVGVDVARWFFLERAPETHMEFDLTLAKEHSEKNPVFYAQYAHARTASILRKAPPQSKKKGRGSRELHQSERALLRELIHFPELVSRLAVTHEVHHLTNYATTVASAFSAFYRDCKVLTDDAKLTAARLELVRATQVVLANTLGLMGIRAPEKM